MKKMRFLIGAFGKKPLLVVLVSMLLLTLFLSQEAQSQVNRNDKQKIVRQVANKWIQVGVEQYRSGFYKSAEQSLLRAQDYQEYLTDEEREKLNNLLEKTHQAVLKRSKITNTIQDIDELIKQGDIAEARSRLEAVKESRLLNDGEREIISQQIETIESKLKAEETEAGELYNRSVELYHNGQLEEAREGFIEVLGSDSVPAMVKKTAGNYLLEIENTLTQKTILSTVGEIRAEEELIELKAMEDKLDAHGIENGQFVIQKIEPVIISVVDSAEPKADMSVPAEEGGYIEVINRRRNVLRSHTRAVVNDAVAKAEEFLNQDQFSKAKEAVETAERIVNQNQLYLGDEFLGQYSRQLKELSARIVEADKGMALKLEEQKRIEASQAQRQYREQMEIDRNNRITELMSNAGEYQKQQRYEEALGQLESLLAIAPLNDQALILKQTLNDVVSFRRQLEIQRESDRERIDVLVKTDEAGIPYADEINYPKNWREITAKRKPEEAIGQDPATSFVYKQFEEIIDLSAFSPEMSFGDAIGEIKNSVEPQLKIIVDWRDLYDTAEIDQTTPINMDSLPDVPLGTGLKLLLKVVSGGFAELGYVIEDGVITIATLESLPSELEPMVYDVTDLLGSPANFFSKPPSGSSSSGGGSGEDVGGGFTDEEDDDMDRDEMGESASQRGDALVLLIQETVEPDNWFDAGGEGTISIYENKKLIVRQTREIHNKVEKLLTDLRKSIGHQVAIEARFLVVRENFLEDIGLDVDFRYSNAGRRFSLIDFSQGSAAITTPSDTGVPGSLASSGIASQLMTTGILDNLQVNILLRATQAHTDAESLTAPKVTVLSGESATIRIQNILEFADDIEIEQTESGDAARSIGNVNYETRRVTSGTILNVTPTITPDKKYVLLNITAQLIDFLGFRKQTIDVGLFGLGSSDDNQLTLEFPQTETSRVQTRVSVPDGGTVLLGGQKLTVIEEKEAGVPILSKVPVIGRLFSNRSKVKDQRVLLILVKPTIILREEAEAEAMAAIGNSYSY